VRHDLQTLPVLPLKTSVLFPYIFMPLSAGRQTSLAAIQASLQTEEKAILIVTQRQPNIEKPRLPDLYEVGTKGIIKRTTRVEQGIDILVEGVERVSIVAVQQEDPFLQVKVEPITFEEETGPEVEALQRAVMELMAQMLELGQKETGLNLSQLEQQATGATQLGYLLASIAGLSTDKEQMLLEARSLLEMLRLLHGYLKRELEVLKLRETIANRAQTEISKDQREYLLRQQLRAIQQELGENSSEKSDIEELRQKKDKAKLPAEVNEEVERELKRLEKLPSIAPDYQVTRSYLEFIFDLPWNKSSTSKIDLEFARRVLDEDHYDLQDVKDRILEHLAVLKLNPKAKAPILCFVGPPGVGKTSLGQSIARALGRKFERMSLGGMHDEAELRGHRRTYIGAMPGRILQSIRRCGVRNPLLMLDEVDKLGRDFRGDPASALLEILDPAQNFTFRDNYLDLCFDLSKVFFITTANTLDTVPSPLLDRMETLRLSGYTEEEKLQIAKRYLVNRRLVEAGIREDQLKLPDVTLLEIVRRYTREAGVRELERAIGRVASKVARHFAEGKTEPVVVKEQDLSELLGVERFRMERARQKLPPGVAPGLAWTPTGGEVLYIEATLMPESEELRLTGQLGDVMRESAKAAQSYLWSHAEEWGIQQSAFHRTGLHIHVPAGAIPKDGPSAGIAMIAAVASAFRKIPCRSDTAVTGEITLSGLILPVGGIKEKILGGRRAGMKRVVLPRDNEKDLREIPEEVRKEMEFILVDRIDDALEAIIPGLRKEIRAVAI